jgi:hypothetical protein
MTDMVSIASILGLGLIIAFAMALGKIICPKTALPVTTEWIEELSVERYRPLLGIADGRNLESISSGHGGDRKLVRQLRRKRCRIVRSHLRDLRADFARVCTAIKLIMVQSDIDRPDLASTLVRSQVKFAVGLVSVHLQLYLQELGIGTIEVGELLRVFNIVSLELRSLVPAPAASGA